MTSEELTVMLNLRATLSEYEHFMCELSTMIERGVDVPPCGAAKFPMREKLYAQVRDLVLGSKAMKAQEPIDIMGAGWEKHLADKGTIPSFKVGDRVSLVASPNTRGVVVGVPFDDNYDKFLVKMDSNGLNTPFSAFDLERYDGK